MGTISPMSQQEEGWPLGLQPLNGRVGLVRNHGYLFGSTSFNTLLTGSPSSSADSSSDLDTKSTGSFFHDNSTTLGTLMGVSTISDTNSHLPRRSSVAKGRRPEEVVSGVVKNETTQRSKTWCFSLCPRNNTAADTANTFDSNKNNNNNPPSLAQFLALERRATNGHHRIGNHCPIIYGPDELALAHPVVTDQPNSLFVDGCVAPPHTMRSDFERREESGNIKRCGVPALLYCICG